jgi:hypothetical protein
MISQVVENFPSPTPADALLQLPIHAIAFLEFTSMFTVKVSFQVRKPHQIAALAKVTTVMYLEIKLLD